MANECAIGYDYNDGGISNQKIALLGLVVASLSEGGGKPLEIYLPRIYSRDQNEQSSSFHSFDDVFWADIFKEFLARWGIKVGYSPCIIYKDRIERGGWNYFSLGCSHLASIYRSPDNLSGIAADFFRSLIPRVRSSYLFQSLAVSIFQDMRIRTFSQLRIEADWVNYSKVTLSVVAPDSEEYLLSAESILEKIRRSISDVGSEVFVLSDEKYLPRTKDEIRQAVFESTGIKIFWKSDLMCSSAYELLSPLDASLIDFELGAMADSFVGLSWSTFANLMAFERPARLFNRASNDYIYNLPGPLLGRRTDMGSRLVSHDVCG